MKHLTDSEIQTYLDGGSDGEAHKKIEMHLAGCQHCRKELQTYRALYGYLSAAPAVSLSPAFAGKVISRLERGESERPLFEWLMFGVSVLIGLAAFFYFVPLGTLGSLFAPLLTPMLESARPLWQYLLSLTTGLDLPGIGNVRLVIFAGLVLLSAALIDRFILQPRLRPQ